MGEVVPYLISFIAYYLQSIVPAKVQQVHL